MSETGTTPAGGGTREGRFRSDGLALRYVEWGSADAPAVIALHGLRSYAHTWEPVAAALAGRFRFIALDMRGRGASDWDPKRDYTAAAYVRDLDALVAHLGLARFALLGHSMGGSTAFVYAAAHPDRVSALIVEDIGPGSSASSDGAERIKRELRETPRRFADWAAASAFWRAQRPHISRAALESRVRHSLRADDGGVVWRHDADGIAAARLAATPAQLVDLWPVVEALTMPTLVLRGARSDFLPAATAAEMTRLNPRIRVVDIAGASHYVHDDNLSDFLIVLESFLATEVGP